MKKSIILITLVVFGTACFTQAQESASEATKTWRKKAAEKYKGKPTDEHKAIIEAAIPTPKAEPKSKRKVLVFHRCEGFIHTSIPFGNYAMEAIAKNTNAFSIDLADEYEVFTKENLAQYDAIIFNSTTNLVPDEAQRAAILDFINGGKGIVGFHAAADNFKQWEEGIALIGGVFTGHPWTAGGTWAFKLEDPDHTLNEAFGGNGFWHKDEIYWYKPENFQGRDRLRVLMSLDMSRPENQKPVEGEKHAKALGDTKPADVDVPVSWLKEVGKGRLFFTNLGHNDMTYANNRVLQHMLDGIQYAMGDIEADATPSSKVEVKTANAPETAPSKN
ncbi:MAG: ThuA domain-containing protein [Verrucomicrobiales bacterium]|nr:ThuA domain-containing protein [Verrucomicrobiales bacterium]